MNTESTKSEDKATPPIPWQYTEDEKAEMFTIHTEGSDPVDGPNEFIACGIWYQSAGREQGKKIAELIVTAVNEYASLKSEVERLKEQKAEFISILQKISDNVDYDKPIILPNMDERIKAALQNSGQ